MTSTTGQPEPSDQVVAARPARTFHSTVAFAAGAMLVSYLPFSAVNGVLGSIGAGAGVGTSSLQWVTDAFTVALTGSVLTGGALAERHGRRRLTVVGLVLTTAGALIGWLAGGLAGADGVHALWAGQAVSGIGGGLVMSATLSLIAATAPSPAVRTRAIAVWAAANVVGLGAGPFLSGAVTGTVSGAGAWRWTFPPIMALAVVTAVFGLLRSRELTTPAAAPLDLAGQAVGCLGVVLLVFGVIRGGTIGWGTPGTVAGLTAASLALAGFFLIERRAAGPTLRPALFRSRGFDAAALAAAAVLFCVVGIVFVFSLVLKRQGVSDLGIAVRVGFLFAGNALASLAAGPLQNRFGSRVVLLGGLVVAGTGLTSLIGIDDGTGLAGPAWRLLIVGAGCGTVIATSTAVAVQSVPGPLAGMAGTANNVIRQLGGALGPAVLGGVLAARLGAGAEPTAALQACAVVLLALIAVVAVLCAALLAHPADR